MTTETRLTLDQFLALPETKPASEYICGEVVQKAMPSGRHSLIQGMLAYLFRLFLTTHPLGECGPEWRCVFGPEHGSHGLVPDFVFIAADRLPSLDAHDGPFVGAPD